MSLIEFWDGASLDVDLHLVGSSAVPVKGKSYSNPCRLLEIYGNTKNNTSSNRGTALLKKYSDDIRFAFLPKIPGVTLRLGADIYHPPFLWCDCPPAAIATNFTYSTNAIYRILSNLAEAGLLPECKIDHILDDVCLLLTAVYKSDGHFIIKHINNNINMFMIAKIIETFLGKSIYDAEFQELDRTRIALDVALEMAEQHAGLQAKQQMGLALGKGIAFLERYIGTASPFKCIMNKTAEVSYKYTERNIMLDDRDILIDMVSDASETGRKISMCAILDDTAETVDDLLWMQQLMVQYPNFHVNLLINTAQISINFASHMFDVVLRCKTYRDLAIRLGAQLTTTKTYCPLISLQNNLLDRAAKKAIDAADFIFIKGLNFFETCQLSDKDVFHSFVVYGPVSRAYTGLPDMSGVFVFLPAGVAGYCHARDTSQLTTLLSIREGLQKKRVSPFDSGEVDDGFNSFVV